MRRLLLSIVLGLAACHADAGPAACAGDLVGELCLPAAPSCGPDEALDESLRCVAAGVGTCGDGFTDDGHHGCAPVLPESPCAGDSIATPGDKACRPVGPTGCPTSGFVLDSKGECAAILPAAGCDAGMMAVPGDAACRPVASCDAAPVGDVHVDAAAPAGGDGTAARPLRTIGEALLAAADGAVIAIERGTYPENVVLARAVTLRGRCPAEVRLVAADPVEPVLTIDAAVTVERIDVAAGAGSETAVHARAKVTLDHVRLHGGALCLWATNNADVTVRDSCLDHTETGVEVQRAKLHLVRSSIGALSPLPGDDYAFGILTDPNATVDVEGSLVADAQGSGIQTTGGVLTVRASVFRDIGPGKSGGFGAGIETFGATQVTLEHVLAERSLGFGVVFEEGGEVSVTDSTFRDLKADPSGSGAGIGSLDPPGKRPLHLVVDRVLVTRTQGFGLQLGGGQHEIRHTRVDGVTATSKVASMGLAVAPSSDKKPVASTLVVEDSLFAHADFGIGLDDAVATITRAEVRDIAQQGIATFDLLGRSQLTIQRCRVERAGEVGIGVFEADGLIEDTLVRDIRGGRRDGRGLNVYGSTAGSTLVARRSVIVGCEGSGIFGAGSTLTLEDLTLSDFPGGASGPGRALEVNDDLSPVLPGALTARRIRVAKVGSQGLLFDGDVAVTLESLLIRDTGAEGLLVQNGARVTATSLRVERATKVGAGVFGGASLTLAGALVLGVAPDAAGAFGDGLSVVNGGGAQSALVVQKSIVRDAQRAGASVFGGLLSVEGSRFLCTAFALDVEPDGESAPQLHDLGANACGCGTLGPCAASSAALAPVSAVEAAPKPPPPKK